MQPGCDELDTEISREAATVLERGGRWTVAGIAAAVGAKEKRVSYRIHRMIRAECWAHGAIVRGQVSAKVVAWDEDRRRLVDRLYPQVRTIARMFAGRHGDADEIESAVQWALTWMAGTIDLDRFDDPDPYVVHSLRKVAFRTAAGLSRGRTATLGDFDVEPAAVNRDVANRDAAEEFEFLCREFDDRDRTIARLMFIHGFTGMDAARSIGLTRDVASKFLSRIAPKVKAAMSRRAG